MPAIVSTHCGCFPELINHKDTGFSMDPLDIESMTQALFKMERTTASEREAMGRQCVEVIQDHRPETWASHVRTVIMNSIASDRKARIRLHGNDERSDDQIEERS